MIWWGSLAISSAWHRGIYWGWPGWKNPWENSSKRKDSKKMLTEIQKFFSQVYIRDWTNLYQHKLQDGEALLQVWQIKARRWSFLYCSLYFLVRVGVMFGFLEFIVLSMSKTMSWPLRKHPFLQNWSILLKHCPRISPSPPWYLGLPLALPFWLVLAHRGCISLVLTWSIGGWTHQ